MFRGSSRSVLEAEEARSRERGAGRERERERREGKGQADGMEFSNQLGIRL